MKKKTVLVCWVVMALCAFADTEIVDGIIWTYTVKNGCARVGVGSYGATAIPRATVGDVVIPSSLGGCPVTCIDTYAFYYCTGLTSMTIPDSVTSIGARAFYGCNELESITIPDSITGIEEYAFYDCHTLTSVMIPNCATNIGNYAFCNCSGLANVTIPSCVRDVGSSAFANCTNLNSVVISEGVATIGSSAFSGCSGLSNVTIPNSVTNIGEFVFNGCSGKKCLRISDEHEWYKVVDNLLLTKDGRKIVSFTDELDITAIPDSVSYIGPWLFRSCCLDVNAQPFSSYDASSFLETLLTLNAADGMGQLYLKNLGLGIAALYDYLDSDNKPISLALPTVEAVPMVVGVSAPIGLSPQLGNIGAAIESQIPNLRGTATDLNGDFIHVASIVANRKCQLFGITSFGNEAIVQVVVTSPFKRLKATDRAKTYNVRGLMRVWLAPGGMGCRPYNGYNLYPMKEQWQTGVGNGVATFLSDSKTLLQFSKDVNTTDEAITEVALRFTDLNVQMPLYYKVEEVVDQNASRIANSTCISFVPDPSNYKMSYLSFGDIRNRADAFRPFTINADVDWKWQSAANSTRFEMTRPYASGGGGVTEFLPAVIPTVYHVYAAVWIQVLDEGNVVDMVPAHYIDDNEWLDSNMPSANAIASKLGYETPLLNFESSIPITYTNIETTLIQLPDFSAWTALYAVDPRYNFAPEDWFSSSANPVASKSEWMQLLGLNGTSSPILGHGGRDYDIFMFVSDQEYLQSIGELQFLPRLENMDGNAAFLGNSYNPNFHGEPFSNRTSPITGNFANGERFWKTYTALSSDSNSSNVDPYQMRLYGVTAQVKSCAVRNKVNPFSQDVSKMLVGTPFDYYVASTNSNQMQTGGRRNMLVANMTPSQLANSYSFGSNSLARISAVEFCDIGRAINLKFTESSQKDDYVWTTAWDELPWQLKDPAFTNGNSKSFLGVELQNQLHEVDRKFLYSYWRDAFALADWIPRRECVTSDEVISLIDSIGFADEAGVKAAIGGSAAEYSAFKAWAGNVKGAGSASGSVAGEAAVVANANAAAAYLLGAERLFENKPKVEFGEVAVGESGTQGTGGTDGTGTAISVAVTVKDGEEAVACAAEKVKEMFEATSDLGDWNGAAKILPTVTVEEPVVGDSAETMRFKVTPGDGTAPKAFLRIRK